MGRRKQNYLPYNHASDWVRAEYIQSRSQYQKWIAREAPAQMPKAPWRVYDEWDGWPAFLNNDNEFANANPHQYRVWSEALVYAHASGIANQQAWFKYKDHPDDIPIRPDFVYRSKGWMGWYSFLGTGPQSLAHKIDVAQQAVEMGVLAIVVQPGNPNNVIHGFVGPGREAVVERCTKRHYRVIKLFQMEEGFNWQAVMLNHGTLYDQDQWIITNVNELVWEYSNDLMFVR